MPGARNSLLSVGVIAILVGVIWIGQGTGYFPYPSSSFMINDVAWAYYGAALAVVGLVVVVVASNMNGRSP
jgi:subtilisin family serine protease